MISTTYMSELRLEQTSNYRCQTRDDVFVVFVWNVGCWNDSKTFTWRLQGSFGSMRCGGWPLIEARDREWQLKTDRASRVRSTSLCWAECWHRGEWIWSSKPWRRRYQRPMILCEVAHCDALRSRETSDVCVCVLDNITNNQRVCYPSKSYWGVRAAHVYSLINTFKLTDLLVDYPWPRTLRRAAWRCQPSCTAPARTCPRVKSRLQTALTVLASCTCNHVLATHVQTDEAATRGCSDPTTHGHAGVWTCRDVCTIVCSLYFDTSHTNLCI